MGTYIKYFAIIICGIYSYEKLLNIKKPVKHIVALFVFTLLLSFAVCLLRLYFKPLSIPVMIVISLVFMTITTGTKVELSITTTILSFGISYAFSGISAMLNTGLFRLFGVEFTHFIIICLNITTAMIQFLLVVLPFKFRRLKNGMPFLISKGSSKIGVLISVLLLSCAIVLSNNKDIKNLIYVIPFVSILVCAMLILFWWRSRLTNMYLERLRNDEAQRVEGAMQEKDARIRQLEEHNEALAKIIHRDNKLIPAMELAVSEYLRASEHTNIAALREKGRELLGQLKEISGARSGVIADYQRSGKKLPVTDVAAVDALMRYMFVKARENGIEFELTISGSVKYMTENIISARDMTTLLADLIENAITATKYSASKKVFVLIGIVDRCYMIDVFDSGVPFVSDTLADLGLRKTTTHADSGGSGIGLMTAFGILKQYNASFAIEAYSRADSVFTKRVAVIFDNQNQYTFLPKRTGNTCNCTERDLFTGLGLPCNDPVSCD